MNKQTITTVRDGNLIRIRTSNGYTISIGIGAYHYCDNKNYAAGGVEGPVETPTSTLEVAVLDSIGNLDYSYTGGNDVAGYVPVSRLGEIVAAVESGDAGECSRVVGRSASVGRSLTGTGMSRMAKAVRLIFYLPMFR